MNIKNTLIAGIYFSCFLIPGKTQNQENYLEGQDTTKISLRSTSSVESSFQQKMIPSSPMAANFNKFQDVPVGYNTGVPNINIPLYTIELNGYSLPITLSYHHSGIKVDQIASEVGLGWVLNLGGTLSRTINGISDESLGSELVKDKQLYDKVTYRDLFDFYTRPLSTGSYFDAETDDGVDRDMFQFSIPEGSGRFFYSGGEPIHVNTKNRKIDLPNLGSTELRSGNGTTYFFNFPLKTKMNIGLIEYNVPTSWKLSTITTPFEEQIEFEYTKTQFEMKVPNFSLTNVECSTNGRNVSIGTHFITEYSPKAIQFENAHVKNITFPGGYIKFIPGNIREDLPNNYSIKEMQIYNYKNEMIRKWEFTYFYTGTPPDVNKSDSFLYKRLMLKQLKEVFSGEVYKFEYDTTNMPRRDSPDKDYYGYCINRGLDNPFPSDTKLNIIGVNREPHSENAKSHSLKEIIYPTGGHVVFNMSLHDNIQAYYNLKQHSFSGGGLKVDSIIWKNTDGSFLKKESYVYHYGTMLCYPSFYYENYYTYNSREYCSISGTPTSHVNTEEASIVFYDLVKRKLSDWTEVYEYKNYNYTFTPPSYEEVVYGAYQHGQNSTMGSEGLDYFNLPTPTSGGSLFLDSKSLSLLGHRFLYMKSFYNDSPLMQLTYLDDYGEEKKKIKYIQTKVPGDKYYGIIRYQTEGEQKTYNKFYLYPIITGSVELSETITTELGIETSEKFTYDKITGNLVKKEVNNSRGQKQTELFLHGWDETTSDFTQQNPSWLVNDNINPDDLLLYKKTIGNSIENAYVLSYQSAKPTTIYEGYTQTDKACFDTQKHMEFKYNDKFRTIEKKQTNGNVCETFLWSYNGLYPVIQIMGADLEKVKEALQLQQLNSYVDYNMMVSEANIQMLSSKLRTVFSNTPITVTTYLYQPLIGIKSMIDPRGITTSYEYDAAGRLKRVKDSKGRILSAYDYHYQNQ